MIQHIPLQFLEFLISISESGRLDECHQIPDRFPGMKSGQVMRLHFSDWHEVADSLETGRLIALIKALTITERMVPGFQAGSVSPVIWLFSKLEVRHVQGLEEVGNWILANTDNEYLPFGSYNYGAKSISELRGHQASAADAKRHQRKAESIRQRQAAEGKAQNATHKIARALQRKDKKAVEALLSQGADVDTLIDPSTSIREAIVSMGWSHLLESR